MEHVEEAPAGAALPYRVHLGLCPLAGAVCRSGCVRSFARLEEAERFAVEVLSRCPPPAPGGDRFAEVRRVMVDGEVLVRHISWGGRVPADVDVRSSAGPLGRDA